MIEIGQKAPDLLGKDQDGKEIRLSDYPGRTIALYFYPKDSTSGCTAQACNLRDNYHALLDAGYQVIGVSVDSADSHKKFIAKQQLPSRSLPTPTTGWSRNSASGARSRCMAASTWARSAPPSSYRPRASWSAS